MVAASNQNEYNFVLLSVPFVINGSLPRLSNETDLQEANSTFAVNSENPCLFKEEYFSIVTGTIISTQIIVKEAEAEENQGKLSYK